MSGVKIIFLENAAKVNDILVHLQHCNDSFYPPLNQTVNLAEYSKKISEKAKTFEAWNKQELVGLVAVYFNDRTAETGYITNVSVYPSLAGNGVASELMKMCMQYATLEKFKEVRLSVSSDNAAALNLYRKFGFEELEANDKKKILTKRIDFKG